MAFFDKLSDSLSLSRKKLKENFNILFDMGPNLNQRFWDNLEETLILSDVGGQSAMEMVDTLRDQATRRALPNAYAVVDLLEETISESFVQVEKDIFDDNPACYVFVGINGTGKTTTIGKLSKQLQDEGKKVLAVGADTFRAAAIDQLKTWADRFDVPFFSRERGSDSASVCFEGIERGETMGADAILIDTAGRLHTSADLMRELEKVLNVIRKKATCPVYTLLVIDATTGQNGLEQAKSFNQVLSIDGVILTKLDGTAKGGIALAISSQLRVPIVRIGIGEQVEDLAPFNSREFAKALVGRS